MFRHVQYLYVKKQLVLQPFFDVCINLFLVCVFFWMFQCDSRFWLYEVIQVKWGNRNYFLSCSMGIKHMTGSWLPYCIERNEYNGMEFPTAFLAFPNDFEYSMVCSFCADFDLDVLKLLIYKWCKLSGFLWSSWIYHMHIFLWNQWFYMQKVFMFCMIMMMIS